MTSLQIFLLAFAASSQDDPAAEYKARIRPLLTTYCVRCHSTEKHKGGLNLDRFFGLAQVRDDIETWQTTLEMLENDEMPPEGKPQPKPEERSFATKWIRALLDREAERRAGDPGPVPIRRLNNAELTYTLRDLTGVDLQPARHLPADSAAGEGFLNATDALTISPDLLAKYYDVFKDVAAHAVLLPDSVRFSMSKFREDWVNEVLRPIRAIHRRYGTDTGEIPVERYLRAVRELGSGKRSIEAIAEREKLSPKYLRILRDALTDRSSIFLGGLGSASKGPAADIAALQALLWRKQPAQNERSLDDRYVPAAVTVADAHTFRLKMPKSKPGAETVFYLAARTVNGSGDGVRVVLARPRFESKGEPIPLADVLRKGDAVRPHLRGTERLEVRVDGPRVAERTFAVDVRLDPEASGEAVVLFDVRRTAAPAKVRRDVDWQQREGVSRPPLLAVRVDDALRKSVADSAKAFRQVFPARLFYPGIIVRDTTVTLERFHRGDRYLSQLMLDEDQRRRMERLWEELHFISRDAQQVRDSLATLVQGEMGGVKTLIPEVRRRAREAEKKEVAAEPSHLDWLVGFAGRAYRRPLSGPEGRALRELYDSLRKKELEHDEAFRSVLARVLISARFLYRLEQAVEGAEPGRVSDWELAVRLSYFLWGSLPDEALRRDAAAGRMHDPDVLGRHVRRMLDDPRSRALAVEFGTQWVEVRAFDGFQGKNPELFPGFDEKLRRAMYEESILFFQDFFRADRPVRALIDADYTFVNGALAKYYGLAGIEGDGFRRVEGVKKAGRGGLLAQASVLSKHSGASRTSPVLRGNFIAEMLLGEKLPRPPDDVPELPDDEKAGELTVRQMVEKHAAVKQCAVCHKRIDPLGFALEAYDTIGRRRELDLGGRPVNTDARDKNGVEIKGLEGLKAYLLTDRKNDFVRQFSRKLLGFALGRRVLISDRKLLEEMAAALAKNDGRVSAAVLVLVQSRQFRYIRGSQDVK